MNTSLRAFLGITTAHLCVDMQRLFAPGSPWETPWMERVLPRVVKLVEKSPSHSVFTRFIPARSPEQAAGMWQPYYRKWKAVTLDEIDRAVIDLMPELRRYAPPAEVFDRPTYSAFSNPHLHPRLRHKKIDTLVISGAETDVCVLSTVLAAVDYGYRVIVARDGVCSSSDQSHDALIELYERRFDVQIELAEVDEIIASWKL